ncbi:Os06g0187600 [Oryza sativa Japonica Group]|uniref:Os06g0187600 protein n=1 Tax=Oryza sativa subsp. japonica TaxID=39947 RepID=A0A0P0WTZ4_ORYSJ|nr:Os06g0187600 [Oryza sativa Japonica Group]
MLLGNGFGAELGNSVTGEFVVAEWMWSHSRDGNGMKVLRSSDGKRRRRCDGPPRRREAEPPPLRWAGEPPL